MADGSNQFCCKPLATSHSVDLFGRPNDPDEKVHLYLTNDNQVIVNHSLKNRLILFDKDGYTASMKNIS